MTETAPEAQPTATAKSGKLSRRTWLIAIGVAAVAGAAWYLWRQHQANAATAAATTSTGTTADTSAVDQSGELSVIQTELESLMAEEGTEPATTTTGTTTTTAQLPAPGSLSVTPSVRHADVGWGKVTGATVYELVIAGAGGKGTGTSHFDRVLPGLSAKVSLAPGRYNARVRAGKSAADVHGKWSADKGFTVPAKKAAVTPVGSTKPEPPGPEEPGG